MPETQNKWAKPVEVSDIDLAFPARAIGNFMPEENEIPEEYWGGHKWADLFASWFYYGVEFKEVVGRDGVDLQLAFRQLQAMLGSFAPQHEHKEAAFCYLCDLFFEKVEYERKPRE